MPEARRRQTRFAGAPRFGSVLAVVVGLLVGAGPSSSVGAESRPASAGDTVVLLHGLGRSAANMLILEWRLEARGRRVCNIDYDTRVEIFERAIDEVNDALQVCAAGARRIDFVTHSLGGLVLRGLLARHPEPRAGRAVMLAPPNAGSEIADQLRGIGFLESVMGPIAGQLGTRDDDLPSRLPPPPIPFGVIAGDRWVNPAGPLWLPAPHDGTVSVASTRLAGMSDHLVLPYTHTFIMNPGVVADQIEVFLRDGRFERPSSAAPH